MDKKLFIFALIILAAWQFSTAGAASAQTMSGRLKGKILLQVESRGEAWYVNPKDEKRYYLGKPSDAYQLIRELGSGITSANLEKIPIADSFSGKDSDGDGLPDAAEDAFGTDKNKKDTDGNGVDDKTELLKGDNPANNKKYALNNSFTNSQKGKIFLQVESHGEAWYINPADGKRYFLARPQDAFNLMRKLGTGIKCSDLNQITASANHDVYSTSDNNAAGNNINNNGNNSANNSGTESNSNSNLNSLNDVYDLLFGNNNNSGTESNADNNTDSNSSDNTADVSSGDNNSGDTGQTEQTQPVYRTADKLSNITFSRAVTGPYNTNSNTGTRNQSVTMKITGYLKEIDPDSDSISFGADKKYEFNQGAVEWTITELGDDGNAIGCNYITSVSASGKDSIANLDIPYNTNNGLDSNGNIAHLPSYDLRLSYDNLGLTGKSELEIAGSLLIPINVTETVIHNKTNLICGNTTETTTATRKDIAVVKFPMTLLNVNANGSLTGSLSAYETANYFNNTSNIVSSTVDAQFGVPVYVGEVTVGVDSGPWNVTWDIEFPE